MYRVTGPTETVSKVGNGEGLDAGADCDVLEALGVVGVETEPDEHEESTVAARITHAARVPLRVVRSVEVEKPGVRIAV